MLPLCVDERSLALGKRNGDMRRDHCVLLQPRISDPVSLRLFTSRYQI